MSSYWLITRETESLLTFRFIEDLLIFLYDNQDRIWKYRVLKNKNDHVVEIHLSNTAWSSVRGILEQS